MLSLLLALSAAAAPPAAQARSTDPWQDTLERTTPAIVAIQFQAPRFFDTETAFDAVATGFVVDKERGIILTNRHVVNPGPSVAEAVLLNQEEVELHAIYRDPVHDFGFYQFDPATVKHMNLPELPLHPEGAKVGTDIRVVGNDAGEKISILNGTLARLDRDAPEYGSDEFNDYNTFYIQAASGTSGGSSGSPVIDIEGRVVALNAGGSNSAQSSFYLPLDRVKRALDLTRQGKPVTRGTLQVIFKYTHFDELTRLGTREATEAAARKADPEGTGMLVATEIIQGGPSAGKIQPGDVLVAVDGKPITRFIPLEAILDDSVGKTLTVSVERAGVPMDIPIGVLDLHSVTPDNFLMMGDGILNPLSNMQARNHNVPPGGAYVAFPGFVLGNAGIPRGAWVIGVNQTRTLTLDDAEKALAAIPDGSDAIVRWVDVSAPRAEQLSVIKMNRRIFPMQRCRRDDKTGLWPCISSPAAPPAGPGEPVTIDLPDIVGKPANIASKSLVYVEAALPFRIEGVPGDNFSGVGLVVDAAQGLVLVDRNTVPIDMAEVSIIVGGQVRIPARVKWIHPEHNFAFIQYDPKLLGDTPLRSAEWKTGPLETNEAVTQVGLNDRLQVTSSPARFAGTQPFTLSVPSTPQFRDYNLELGETFEAALDRGGVLVDKKGRVRAWWASFLSGWGDKTYEAFHAVSADDLAGIIDALRRGETPDTRSLGVELRPMTLSEARERGLPAAEMNALANAGQSVYMVGRIAADAPAAKLLQSGDVVLSLNGVRATSLTDFDRAGHAASAQLRVWRDGDAVEVTVPSRQIALATSDRALIWAGAVMHDAHPAVAMQRGFVPEGAYVAWTWYGSPSDHYNLRGTWRVLAVDDVPTPDLAAFEKAVSGRKDQSAVRLKVQDLDGRTSLISMELDLQYWPTARLEKVNGTWVRTEI